MREKDVQGKNIKWKPVAISGAVFDEGCEDLIGIEECTEYELLKNQVR